MNNGSVTRAVVNSRKRLAPPWEWLNNVEVDSLPGLADHSRQGAAHREHLVFSLNETARTRLQ
jgi:hypothetical protein